MFSPSTRTSALIAVPSPADQLVFGYTPTLQSVSPASAVLLGTSERMRACAGSRNSGYRRPAPSAAATVVVETWQSTCAPTAPMEFHSRRVARLFVKMSFSVFAMAPLLLAQNRDDSALLEARRAEVPRRRDLPRLPLRDPVDRRADVFPGREVDAALHPDQTGAHRARDRELLGVDELEAEHLREAPVLQDVVAVVVAAGDLGFLEEILVLLAGDRDVPLLVLDVDVRRHQELKRGLE